MALVIDIERERALLRVRISPEDAGRARMRTSLDRLGEAVEQLGREIDLYAMVVYGARHLTPARLGAVISAVDPESKALRAAATRLAWQIDCCPKPVVTVIDGPATGLLAGLAAHTTHRVAGAGYSLAPAEVMAETLPLGGVSHVLARFPAGVGSWLAVTGAALGVHEAAAWGLLTHAFATEHLEEVERSLVDAEPIDPLLDARHTAGTAPPRPLPPAAVLACFAREDRADILADLGRLDVHHRPIGEAVARQIEAAPTPRIETTLALLRRARSLDLRETMLLELAVAEGAAPGDAAIVDPLGLPTRAALQTYRRAAHPGAP